MRYIRLLSRSWTKKFVVFMMYLMMSVNNAVTFVHLNGISARHNTKHCHCTCGEHRITRSSLKKPLLLTSHQVMVLVQLSQWRCLGDGGGGRFKSRSGQWAGKWSPTLSTDTVSWSLLLESIVEEQVSMSGVLCSCAPHEVSITILETGSLLYLYYPCWKWREPLCVL